MHRSLLGVFLLSIVLSFSMIACSHTGATSSESAEAGMNANDPAVWTITVGEKKGRTYANIRLAADGSSPKVATVSVGTELRCLGRDGDWYQVRVPDSMQLGWIKNIYIEE